MIPPQKNDERSDFNPSDSFRKCDVWRNRRIGFEAKEALWRIPGAVDPRVWSPGELSDEVTKSARGHSASDPHFGVSFPCGRPFTLAPTNMNHGPSWHMWEGSLENQFPCKVRYYAHFLAPRRAHWIASMSMTPQSAHKNIPIAGVIVLTVSGGYQSQDMESVVFL